MKSTYSTGPRGGHVLTWRHMSLVEGIMFGGMRGTMREGSRMVEGITPD